ncbi:MAG: hypothetical protein V3R29_09610 [Candidatus Acidoferrales bacterium]
MNNFPTPINDLVEQAIRGIEERNFEALENLSDALEAAGRVLNWNLAFVGKILFHAKSNLDDCEEVVWDGQEWKKSADVLTSLLRELIQYCEKNDLASMSRVLNSLVRESYRLQLEAAAHTKLAEEPESA